MAGVSKVHVRHETTEAKLLELASDSQSPLKPRTDLVVESVKSAVHFFVNRLMIDRRAGAGELRRRVAQLAERAFRRPSKR